MSVFRNGLQDRPCLRLENMFVYVDGVYASSRVDGTSRAELDFFFQSRNFDLSGLFKMN